MKILIFSGSRADWSGLELLSEALKAAGHEIEILKVWPFDPKPITRMDAFCVMTSVGHAAINPLMRNDLVILLGDRYEVLAVATAAYMMGVPIAHLCGGDITIGSDDDQMRDAISILAALHFPSNQNSANRIVGMGIHPSRVFATGSPAIDRVMNIMETDKVYAPTGLVKHVMLAIHPSAGTDVDECSEILAACEAFEDDLKGKINYLIVDPNADAGNASIADQLGLFIAASPATRSYIGNLEPDKYLSILKRCALIVGNSSCGIYEAPALGVPTINVGARQKGRLMAASVRGVDANRANIRAALRMAIYMTAREPYSPYGDGNACEGIVAAIGALSDVSELKVRMRPVRSLAGWLHA